MAASSLVRSSVYNLIKSRILMSGPITVADYMKMALTTQPIIGNTTSSVSTNAKDQSSVGGYYMKKDVFGEHGDFITSPEISQMFGELLGVWGIQTWMQIGGPKKFSIVELGPGRGTLSKDLLRVFKQFEHLTGNEVSLHLVEISPFLASVQAESLCSSVNSSQSHSPPLPLIDPCKESAHGKHYHHGIASETGYPVYWYRDVKDLPKEFHFYVAHEFFDALPIHKLQRDGKEWREVLVDLLDDTGFRFIISRNETPIIKLLRSHYSKVLEDSRQHIEVSLDGLSVLSELTNRLESDGGITSIIDYGHEGTKEDTFRGFMQHKLHDPLVDPGKADLTADVDFSVVKKLFRDKAKICGPVSQRHFLNQVGIDYRLQTLVEKCQDEKEKENLISGYKMMMEDMGSRFLLMTLLPKVLETCLPNLKIAGFDE